MTTLPIFITIFSFLFSNFNTPVLEDGIPDSIKKEIIIKVNAIRSKGCNCGNKYHKPVGPLVWNETLYMSARNHAIDMSTHHFFDHYSSDGLNIGQRLDKVGFPWMEIGENLGEGQNSFDEVLNDWLNSPSHCSMLMNPKVNEMAVARYKNYWVQHFGKRLPPGRKRIMR